MNNNEETKIIKIGGDVEARTSEDYTNITLYVPIDVTFSRETTAEEIENIAFDEIDVLASAVADQTAFVGDQLVACDYSRVQIMKFGDGLKALGKFSAGLMELSESLRTTAKYRRADKRELKFIPQDVNAECAERNRLFEKFTSATGERLEESDTDNSDEILNSTIVSEKNQEFLGTHEQTDLRILARKIGYIISHEDISEETKIKLENKFEEWAGDTGVYVTSPEVIEITFSLIMFYLGNRKNNQPGEVIEFIDSIISDLSKEHKNELKQFDSMPGTLNAITEDEKLAAQISEIMHNPFLPEHLKNVIADEINRGENAEFFTPESVLYNLEVLRFGGEPIETGFIPTASDAPTISDIPHSRPVKKRTPTQKPKIKTKKAEKPKNKQQ